ncbi:hypothetical protein PoB_002576000 [Plakobranchus ocellatus]|uniref:Uncharacterized protein n=1 Tax=Plakobranchus ocellatus TaxID=259542 RepID=A0AAV3ZVQ7_9GAST|nr:hypothetical protein PoB_002576000 [Plakobranchus ocellatus]
MGPEHVTRVRPVEASMRPASRQLKTQIIKIYTYQIHKFAINAFSVVAAPWPASSYTSFSNEKEITQED